MSTDVLRTDAIATPKKQFIDCYIRIKGEKTLKKASLEKIGDDVLVPKGYELAPTSRCLPFTKNQWDKMNNNEAKYGV